MFISLTLFIQIDKYENYLKLQECYLSNLLKKGLLHPFQYHLHSMVWIFFLCCYQPRQFFIVLGFQLLQTCYIYYCRRLTTCYIFLTIHAHTCKSWISPVSFTGHLVVDRFTVAKKFGRAEIRTADPWSGNLRCWPLDHATPLGVNLWQSQIHWHQMKGQRFKSWLH